MYFYFDENLDSNYVIVSLEHFSWETQLFVSWREEDNEKVRVNFVPYGEILKMQLDTSKYIFEVNSDYVPSKSLYLKDDAVSVLFIPLEIYPKSAAKVESFVSAPR